MFSFFGTMRRISLIVFICFILMTGLMGQISNLDTVNQFDNEGKKHGYWTKHGDNGSTLYEGYFNHDVPVGEFKFYYTGGRIKALVKHKGDGVHSNTTIYHKNGYIMATGGYIGEVKDGLWIYYDVDGIKVSEEFWQEKKKNGKWKSFYHNGSVAEETIWIDNQKQGTWIQYFTDGTIKLAATYLNNLKEGIFNLYYPNQQLTLSGKYLKGKRDGEWKHFMEDGQLQKQQIFSNGILVSEVIYIELEEESAED